MNYYAARKRQSNGLWDFTCMNDGSVWPVGYCKAFREMAVEDASGFASKDDAARVVAEHNRKFSPLQANYHAGGHATQEEARACYRKYLLDTRARFSDKPNEEEQRRCAICKAWTQHSGSVDDQIWPLCQEHQTRDSLEKLAPPIGEIASS